MSETEIVTWPEITTPLSSTRLIRSPSTSCSPSSGSSSNVRSSGTLGQPSGRRCLCVIAHEMIRRPWSSEIEAKSVLRMLAHERAEARLECVVPRARDEKRGIEDLYSSRRVGRHIRDRGARSLHRMFAERVEDLSRDALAHLTQLGLSLRVELALHEIALAGGNGLRCAL